MTARHPKVNSLSPLDNFLQLDQDLFNKAVELTLTEGRCQCIG